MVKTRLDLLLVLRGLAEDQSQAQRLVMAGQVRVDGQVALHSSTSVPNEAVLSVDRGPRFVSRGGEKLEAALQAFGVGVSGRVCADVGASTGGFTDCLLQHGAARVYAIDVGEGILDWKLRQDRRVVVMEGANARMVQDLPEKVSLVTIDASFISLKVLLPVVKGWLDLTPLAPLPEAGRGGKGRGQVIALIKPQFEASRKEVGRGRGVIRDAAVHRQVLREVLAFAQQLGFGVRGLRRSPLLGPKGNVEFLAWLVCGGEGVDLERLIDEVLRNPNSQHLHHNQ